MIRRLFPALALAALAAPAAAQSPTPPTPPAPCQEAERGQFDFWVGEWDVYPTGQTALVAHSRIEKLYGGCAVRENWMPLKGTGGGSLNAFVPADGGWRQTWTDSSGAWVDFRGGWTGTAMVLQGSWPGAVTPGQPSLVRMTYTKNADGSVRQFGEGSTDGGATWAPNFDFTFRPSKPD